MKRIQPAGWAAIALIVLLVGYFSFKHFKGSSGGDTVKTEQTVSSNTTEVISSPTAAANGTISINLPPAPVNGALFGVVEVGASGFNSFVVEEDKNNNWKLIMKDFGESLSYEGLASVDDIKDGLKKYLAKMLNKGVAAKNLHFVISSGALKNPKTTDISAAIKKMGYFVNEVTPEQEGKYGAIASIIPEYRDKSFSLDVGSGNTKINWYEGNEIKTVEASGSKYFQNGISDADAYSEIKRKASQVPEKNREYCFVIGGSPYEFAKQSGISKTQRYIDLKDPSDLKDNGEAKYKSGLTIYKAVKDGTGTKTFVFDADANFTIGFLLKLKH